MPSDSSNNFIPRFLFKYSLLIVTEVFIEVF